MRLLTLENIAAFYGSVQALHDVSLELSEGQVLALMGRNGMGKSTTIRSLCRLMPISSGKLSFYGNDLSSIPAHKVAQLGIGLVPEGRRCFAPLTVRENLNVAARPGPWTESRVTELFPRLAERSGQIARTLSGGEQQMLAIGRALMTNPRLLVLDEATEGLAPVVRQEIWAAIRRLKGEGLSILLVDKSLAELKSIADHGVILDRGSSVWQGKLQDLSQDQADKWLGI